MNRSFQYFIQSESGAVTVDYVVLTAAVIGMGVAVTASIGSGITSLSNKIAADLSGTSLVSNNDLIENYVYQACPAGIEGAIALADANFAEGNWPENTYDYDYGDVQMILAEQQDLSDAQLKEILGIWRNDYATRPEAFANSTSNRIEYALHECVAASRGISL